VKSATFAIKSLILTHFFCPTFSSVRDNCRGHHFRLSRGGLFFIFFIKNFYKEFGLWATGVCEGFMRDPCPVLARFKSIGKYSANLAPRDCYWCGRECQVDIKGSVNRKAKVQDEK